MVSAVQRAPEKSKLELLTTSELVVARDMATMLERPFLVKLSVLLTMFKTPGAVPLKSATRPAGGLPAPFAFTSKEIFEFSIVKGEAMETEKDA